MGSFTWSPLDLTEKNKLNLGNYALLILNRPITVESKAMASLWKGASLRHTVDGGTTRWFDYLKNNDIELDNKFPDIVSGDFDSISPSLLKTCEEHGVYIEKTPDQDYTDFEKAVHVIKKRYTKKLDSLLVIIDSSGRLDHTFSNLNTLYRVPSILPETTAYLVTSVSITWILKPGNHTIKIPSYLREEHEWCSILPFSPVKNSVTTTGLKWNLNKNTIEFGGLISSSNTYNDSPEVTLSTDAHIIWSMGLGRED